MLAESFDARWWSEMQMGAGRSSSGRFLGGMAFARDDDQAMNCDGDWR